MSDDKLMTVDISGIRAATSNLTRTLGLEPDGPAQKFFTQEMMRQTDKYVPMDTGMLAGSAQRFMEPDAVVYYAPYAQYLYYGKLMVDPETLKGAFHDEENNMFWSRPGMPKILDPDGRSLQYDTSKHPLAGPMWAERSWADNGEKITAEVEEFIMRRYIK